MSLVTKDDIDRYLAHPEWYTDTGAIPPTKRRITCLDGFSLSVQASRTHYCRPRSNKGPWNEVEVGFPTRVEEALMPYAEDRENPTGTVYGCVPIGVVVGVVNAHGGAALGGEQ